MLSLNRALLDAGQLVRAALLLVAIPLFDSFDTGRLWQVAWKDWAHVPVFALATGVLLHALRDWIREAPHTLLPRMSLTAVLAFAVGAGIELIQPFLGRDRSLLDLIYDGVGIAMALSLFIAETARPWRRWLWYGLAMLLLGLSLSRPLWWLQVVAEQHRILPSLVQFDRAWGRHQFEANPGAEVDLIRAPDLDPDIPAESWLRVRLIDGAYPGVVFKEMHPDWRDYGAMKMGIFLQATEALPLTVRIDDQAHNQDYTDRFNQTFLLHPGWNALTIPLDAVRQAPRTRELDLARITRVLVFSTALRTPVVILIDGLRLANKATPGPIGPKMSLLRTDSGKWPV
jgi:hypothetical protein